jgi:hypothetical protein
LRIGIRKMEIKGVKVGGEAAAATTLPLCEMSLSYSIAA